MTQLAERELPVVQTGGALTAAQIKDRVNLIQQVMRSVMKDGTHYDVIPGTEKPTLLKPGAEVLCMTFQIAPSYVVEDLSGPDEVRYAIICTGTHQQTGVKLGEGLGECSSSEEKYKWRRATKTEWERAHEERRRVKYGYSKQDRKEYEILQVRTEPADVANTVRKMAAKRAQVAMTLNVTAASDMFSQDLEEMSPELRESLSEGEQKRTVKQPKAKEKPADKPAEPGPAMAGTINQTQAAIIRKTLERGGKDEAGLCKHFGIESVEALPMAKINEGLAWCKEAA